MLVVGIGAPDPPQATPGRAQALGEVGVLAAIALVGLVEAADARQVPARHRERQ